MQKKIDGTVVAIDLGSSKIKVMAAIGSEEYYEVVFHEERKSQGIINGEVVNIKSVAESLSPIISKIKEEFPSPIARIAIGITGYNLRSYTIKERVSRKEPNHIISNNEIEELIEKVRKGGEKRGEVVLDVIPQNYNVDDNMGVDQASGMTGTNIEGIFKVISLKERGYLNSHKLAEYMKLEEYWLTLSPVAAAEGVLTPDEFDLGAVLLNIGAENVEMVICHNNKVREVAIIPFGGGSITKDISHFCGITFDKAERVKCEEGSCISNSIIEEDTILLEGSSGIEREVEKRSVINIIEARVGEIVEALLYLFERSGYSKKLRGGVVITGGASQLLYLNKFIEERFKMEVRVANPRVILRDGIEKTPLDPSYAVAAGLIKKGFGNLFLIGGDEERDRRVGKLFDDSGTVEESPKKEERRGHRGKKSNLGTMFNGMFEHLDNGV